MKSELQLGWVTLELQRNQKKITIEKPKKKIDATQLPKDWFTVNSDDFSSIGQQFDKLKISEFLKGIEATASEVFPFSYDTSSHWFYYVLFNTKKRVTQSENRKVKKILKSLNLRHGMGNDALKKGAIRHPMPNLPPGQSAKLKLIRKQIFSNFKKYTMQECRGEFRKIWTSQISDPKFKKYLLKEEIEFSNISKSTFNSFQIETKKIIFSYLIIRSLYGSPWEDESHKQYCKKALELMRGCSVDVLKRDMNFRIRTFVEQSQSKNKAIWISEAKKAVENKRPVYRSYRVNAFFKVYNQLAG